MLSSLGSAVSAEMLCSLRALSVCSLWGLAGVAVGPQSWEDWPRGAPEAPYRVGDEMLRTPTGITVEPEASPAGETLTSAPQLPSPRLSLSHCVFLEAQV